MPISAAGLAHGEHGEYHVEYYHGDDDDDGSKCHRSVSAEEVH
jgi:hypothetical protein